MEGSQTYHLNKIWKWLLVGTGILGVVFLAWMVWLSFSQDISGFDNEAILALLFFLLLLLELIYEGTQSRIVVTKDELVYYQPRFCLVCKWEDLTGLFSPRTDITLKFSKADISYGKLVAYSLRLLGPWHRLVPLTPYLSRENRLEIGRYISPHIDGLSEVDKNILKYALGI